ncbi:hypothetical protein F0562_034849 [Nyssa sinensis]|uniref:Uncharacterized protein n=1 Tax=Nyssa sinensis TaxID=561372 RepID=A0A5J5ACE2_9ASTE|nr:hypothetical protein F0562_034849 [Nyssa sinensis]
MLMVIRLLKLESPALWLLSFINFTPSVSELRIVVTSRIAVCCFSISTNGPEELISVREFMKITCIVSIMVVLKVLHEIGPVFSGTQDQRPCIPCCLPACASE